MKKHRRELTADEKNALIFQFLDAQEGDSGPRARALTAAEESLLASMADGSLPPEDLAKCEALLLRNRVALDFMAATLRAGKGSSQRPLARRDVLS